MSIWPVVSRKQCFREGIYHLWLSQSFYLFFLRLDRYVPWGKSTTILLPREDRKKMIPNDSSQYPYQCIAQVLSVIKPQTIRVFGVLSPRWDVCIISCPPCIWNLYSESYSYLNLLSSFYWWRNLHFFLWYKTDKEELWHSWVILSCSF